MSLTLERDGHDNSGTNPATLTINDVGLVFANANAITINDVAVASPYPSTIAVAGATGTIASVKVTLNGFSHTFPGDVDILLVGPAGQKFIIVSDAGDTATTNQN